MTIKRIETLTELINYDNNDAHIDIDRQRQTISSYMEIMKLLVDFPVKRLWNSYVYHKNFHI
jgi:hypothetical protein